MEDTNKMKEKKEMKVKKIKASRSILDLAAYLVAKKIYGSGRKIRLDIVGGKKGKCWKKFK